MSDDGFRVGRRVLDMYGCGEGAVGDPTGKQRDSEEIYEVLFDRYKGPFLRVPSQLQLLPDAPATPEPQPADDGKPDMVNTPPHYTQGGIECIDAIEAALTPEEFRGFLKGNVLKYTWRERHKGGLESLRKAGWYLRRLTGEPA